MTGVHFMHVVWFIWICCNRPVISHVVHMRPVQPTCLSQLLIYVHAIIVFHVTQWGPT